MIVPDNASPEELGEEPEGFWEPIRAQVDVWVAKYGSAVDDVESD